MAKRKVDPELIDAENPEWTTADFKRSRPAAEALTPEFLTKVRSSKPTVRNVSDAEYEATKRRGRPVSATHKVRLTMRVDPDVEAFFRATGRGWQTRINDALANVVRRQRLSGAKSTRSIRARRDGKDGQKD